ncbi:AAA domain-containing protein [Hyunsoonleella jejuensis]|uniref:AAA domain-containing protein n=1 Tax=Hyunsoonleella jejuensis TaxID=419940 RepID=A0A1H9CNW0_9FLAO|nr:PIN domain-containing protein [Hyunsoonleella jejuensis]SEQ02902.1 AAA domain-containing protein [Hyunsoonleella jejuensis]
MVTKENQVKFYAEELKELEFSVKKIFNATGLSLFQNGDVYVGQYRGLDEKRGNVFVDIPTGKQYHAPRLDQKLTCFTLQTGLERPSSWGNLTYSDLLKDRNRTDTKIVDYIPSKREGWITMLIREMDAEFIESLQYNQILAFGPTIPPYEYLQNLKEFSESFNADGYELWEKILSFKFDLKSNLNPKLLTEEIDIAEQIITEVEKSRVYVFQGPPGTGKTHQVADLVSRLVLSNKSVLITALTNKAAVEVCEKPFFDKLFDEQRVSKLPISIDERRKFPKLINTKDLLPSKGHLILTTFYQFSRIWKEHTLSFDYIIVEEASQAYLTTIAAACKVGKKVIVVGDPKQILPIVTNKNYKMFSNIDALINGMNTLSQIRNFSFNRKIETRRLTKRSTRFTNCFYNNTIQSKSLYENIEMDLKKMKEFGSITHSNGGPTLVQFSNKQGDVLSQMIKFLVKGLNELTELKGNEIAVLTPYIETLTYLQQKLKSKTNSRNFSIESVDRVQGLDVDYCFYVIPKSSSFSYNINRFNVATSRAKKSTYILVEQDFDRLVNLPNEVGNYLSKLRDEFTFTINSVSGVIAKSAQNDAKANARINNPEENNQQNLLEDNIIESSQSSLQKPNSVIKIKVIDKIDVSKFEKPKKEIKKNKENLYIIDTNVFVDYPDIISKINKKYPVILSAKVLDELDNLKSKLDNERKINVQKALKSINHHIDKRDLRMEISDASLLSNDFSKRSPDNLILTVALKFKSENPIILTSDNGLQIKSKGLNITTITLKEFLKQKR